MAAPRTRTRRPDVRPDQILDAAQGLLLDGGAAALTMDAVAEAAGIGKGTIYHYYRSKAEVLSALRARHLTRTVAEAETAARSGRSRSTVARIERFLDALLDAAARDAALVWVLFHQTAIEEENELAGVEAALAALIREGIEAGDLVLADPDFTAAFLLHGLHGTVESAFHEGQSDLSPVRAGIRSAARALLAG